MKLVLREDELLKRGHFLISYRIDDKEVVKGIIERLELCMKKCILYESDNARKAYPVSYAEIYKIEMKQGKVFAYGNRGNAYQFQKEFNVVKEEVKPYYFTQISKLMLVNTLHVAYFEKIHHYRLRLTMDNGETVIVNRSYHKSFIQAYENT